MQKNFPELKDLPEGQWDLESRGTIEYFIAPNTILSHSVDHMAVYRFLPTAVDEPERMIELFERLGFRRAFRYQKYRTTYRLAVDGQELEVTFDETPMGNFIEIEGDESTVLRILEQAGFSAADSVRESYPELQASRCRRAGIPLEDLVFSSGQ